jgi:hypothetical protein
MTGRQSDFWQPAPFDFEAVVSRVDMSGLAVAHRRRAAKHAYTESPWKTEWNMMEPHHDKYDRVHFDRTGLSVAFDLWDNRRKGGTQ